MAKKKAQKKAATKAGLVRRTPAKRSKFRSHSLDSLSMLNAITTSKKMPEVMIEDIFHVVEQYATEKAIGKFVKHSTLATTRELASLMGRAHFNHLLDAFHMSHAYLKTWIKRVDPHFSPTEDGEHDEASNIRQRLVTLAYAKNPVLTAKKSKNQKQATTSKNATNPSTASPAEKPTAKWPAASTAISTRTLINEALEEQRDRARQFGLVPLTDGQEADLSDYIRTLTRKGTSPDEMRNLIESFVKRQRETSDRKSDKK